MRDLGANSSYFLRESSLIKPVAEAVGGEQLLLDITGEVPRGTSQKCQICLHFRAILPVAR